MHTLVAAIGVYITHTATNVEHSHTKQQTQPHRRPAPATFYREAVHSLLFIQPLCLANMSTPMSC